MNNVCRGHRLMSAARGMRTATTGGDERTGTSNKGAPGAHHLPVIAQPARWMALAAGVLSSIALAQPLRPSPQQQPLLPQALDNAATPDAPVTARTNYKIVITTHRNSAAAGAGADVTVLSRAAIEQSGAASIGDLLQRQHSVELSRNGGPGTATGIHLRGAASRFTAVYIDGVRVDTQSSGGAPWEAIALAQVERIEIIRGPAAAAHGSGAVAGAVHIVTQRGAGVGPATPHVTVAAATRHGWTLQTGLRGSSAAFDYALGVSREGSRGYNVMPAGDPDRDGWRQQSLNAQLGWQVAPAQRLEFAATHNDIRAQYDGFVPGQDDRARNRLSTLGLTWSAHWTAHYSTRLAVSQSAHHHTDSPSGYSSKTQLSELSWHNGWQRGAHGMSLDLTHQHDRLVNVPIARQRQLNALTLGYDYDGAAHELQVRLRHTRDSEFGGQNSASLGWSYTLAPGWQLAASAGIAHRVPTLYQRFSELGTAALQPEKSRSADLALRWSDDARSWGLTLWRNQVRNLIDFGLPGGCASVFGCYINAGQVRLQGVTLNATQRMGRVNLAGSLDWQQPRDATTGQTLARRASWQLKLNADTQAAGWTLGAEWQLASHRWDDTANTVRLAGYGVLNAYASKALTRHWDVLLRLDNATNRHYELAHGYTTPPLRALLQLRWTAR